MQQKNDILTFFPMGYLASLIFAAAFIFTSGNGCRKPRNYCLINGSFLGANFSYLWFDLWNARLPIIRSLDYSLCPEKNRRRSDSFAVVGTLYFYTILRNTVGLIWTRESCDRKPSRAWHDAFLASLLSLHIGSWIFFRSLYFREFRGIQTHWTRQVDTNLIKS